MLRSNYVVSTALLLSATSVMAQSTQPTEVPQVTVGADTKLLIFDWDPVPGATYYQLYVNPDGQSGYTATGGQIAAPGTRAGSSVAVHLQHWQTALYRLAACNAAGCRNSKSLFPRRHMLETIGYFKASNTDPGDGFGSDVVLSGDGDTMAVTAMNEASNATGVNGNQTNNSLHASGAVYLYRKVSGHWKQEAYLKPPLNRDNRHFGVAPAPGTHALALSRNGSLLAVGTPDSTHPTEGAVTTYVRTGNGTWSLNATLQAPAGGDDNGFGSIVDLSDDGNTLLVQGYGYYESGNPRGESFVFTRSTSGGWTVQQSLAPHEQGDLCDYTRLSGDGSTIVQLCIIDLDSGNRVSGIETYKRSGSSWTFVNEYGMPDWEPLSSTISHDASRLALRAAGSGDQVAVFRWDTGVWVMEAQLEAPLFGSGAWGGALSLNGNGSLLAIGDRQINPPAAPGVSENVPAGDPAHAGSAYIYRRNAVGTSVSWDFRSLVLAPNPGENDGFGSSVSMSATGNTLAVGAPAEDSGARGINGSQTDNGSADAGAAYLY